MKKKIILFIMLSALILSTRIVYQPQYDHYAIGNNFDESCIVFTSKEIKAIWIGDNLYVPATEMDYMNY